MAAAFAALEARLNMAVFARLSNADISIDYADAVPAIFENFSHNASVGPYGMAATQPALTLATTDVPASPLGLRVDIGEAKYLIATHEPDGTGVSRLLLEIA